MPSRPFHEFELELNPVNNAGYLLVVRSPAGETRQSLALPFAVAELATWRQRLEASRARSVDSTRHLGWQSPATDDSPQAQQFGAALFNAVFTGNVLSLFDASRALARQDDSGLRIRLRILAPQLANLPWELLFDPRQGEFLCLSQQTPLVRSVESMQPIETLIVTPPLRILGMAASPLDLQPLDVAHEKELLQGAVAKMNGQIELVWTSGGSWRDLQGSLQQGPWHIFHFIGHGLFDDAAAEGALVLTDAQGRADLRNTLEVSRLVADHSALRLAVLNACEGAQTGTQALYASIAEHLVRRGLPAVLAMQYTITDAAAVEFTRSFYGALANELPVDAACAEARKAMSLAAPDSWEWATPVLFLRSPDGELWTKSAKTARAKMGDQDTKPWWEQVPNAIGTVNANDTTGDVIITVVGAGAKNVAAGKNITQTVTEMLGPRTPDDKTQIEQGFAKLLDALARLQLDEAAADRAKTRIEILQEELGKADDDVPSASTIARMGDWLLDNLPAIGEELGALFALPAVGRVVGKAGEGTVKWVTQRLSSR